MINKPEISQVAAIAPEAKNLEEIDSGGFKVVYKAKIGMKIEALKLAYIPSNPNDPAVKRRLPPRELSDVTLEEHGAGLGRRFRSHQSEGRKNH